ncbi:MAG: hypothetical protein EH225_08390 [Calditrichaeota bacterium]|nr:hypothetical protein [Calditrichota bacterium]RQW02492.1 MAG: hypothetical protein EH225_08390 [Calditrichota bacterium]
MNNLSGKYFIISLTFNFVVVLSFLFFTFIYPAISDKSSATKKNYTYPISSSQQVILDSLDSYYAEKESALRTTNIQNRLRLWEKLMEPGEIDTSEINQIMTSLIRGENALKDLRYRHYLQEQYTLTPEQRKERIGPIHKRLKKYLDDLKE